MASPDAQTKMYEVDVFRGSWLRRRFPSTSSRVSISVIVVWLVFCVLPLAVFLSAWSSNSLFLEGKRQGLLEDYVTLSYAVYVPSLIVLALWLFPKFSLVLHTLEKVTVAPRSSGSSLKKGADYGNNLAESGMTRINLNAMFLSCEERALGKGNFRYVRAVIYIGAWSFVSVMTTSHWFAVQIYGVDFWGSRHHLANFVIQEVYDWVVFGFVFPFIISKYVAILHSMRAVCKELTQKQALRIRTLSPDRAGGLGEFGKYSLKMTTFLIPPMLPILAYVASGTYSAVLVMGVSVYTLFVPFAFFYPLSGAHQAMREQKGRELDNLSAQFNRVYDSLVTDTPDVQGGDLRTNSEMVDRLGRLYLTAEKMPVWPFDTTTLTRLIGLVVAMAASLAIEPITRWLESIF